MSALPLRDTSVYLHFPWCLKKCPYCDFATTQVEARDIPHARYADAIVRELRWRQSDLAARRLCSVFFGGGTPSLWEPACLARVLTALREAFPAEAAELEVTLECNPSSFAVERIAALVDAGINRFSFGVQSLDDEVLAFLGRDHNSATALACVARAVQAGARISADLMFGMAGLATAKLGDDLERLLATGVRHISAYALTIEEQTRFGALHRAGKLPSTADDVYRQQYELIEAQLGDRGFDHYEVSNYALPDEEARHNMHYWTGGDYLGLGAAAVGKLLGSPGDRPRRWRNDPVSRRYLEASSLAKVEVEEEVLSPSEELTERLMLGLRTSRGVPCDAFHGEHASCRSAERTTRIATALDRGELTRIGGAYRVPQSHWFVLDGILAGLIP